MLNTDAGALNSERVALRVRIAISEGRGGNYAALLEARDRLIEVTARRMRDPQPTRVCRSLVNA
jgi:hypothetical protein